MSKNKIGNLIKKARKNKGMTLQQVADLCGTSNSMVSHWERGINIPAGDVLVKLAKKLDFIEELMADDPTDEEFLVEEVARLTKIANDVSDKLSTIPDKYLNQKSPISERVEKIETQFSKLEKKISKFEKQLKDISDMKERMNAIENQYNINQNRDIVLNTAGSKKT